MDLLSLLPLWIILAPAAIWHFLNAIPLYSIAKQQKIPYKWLAFLPLGQDYILGAIADNTGKYMTSRLYSGAFGQFVNENLRFILPGYKLIYIIYYVMLFLGIWGGGQPFAALWANGFEKVSAELTMFISFIMNGLNAMAIYKIFDIYKSNRASLFTVISVFFSFTRPFLMFYCLDLVRKRKVIRFEDYYPGANFSQKDNRK